MIFYYTFTAESDSERILKIGQHLPKLWAIKYRVVLYETWCRDDGSPRFRGQTVKVEVRSKDG